MADTPQTIKMQAELDASATVVGARDVSRELIAALKNAKELENVTKNIFASGGNLPRQLRDLVTSLKQIQELPQQMKAVQRAAQQMSTGGPNVQLQNAAFAGVRNAIKSDGALQAMIIEKDYNKVLEARAQIYRRLREAMPEGASQQRLIRDYRDALRSLGELPEKGAQDHRKFLARTRTETMKFESDITRALDAEVQKRNQNALRASKATMAEETRLQRQHQQELSRLFRRDMGTVMTGGTPDERRAMAAQSVQRLQTYAGNRGMTGFNEGSLMAQYDDAESKRFARDIDKQINASKAEQLKAVRATESAEERHLRETDALLRANVGYLRSINDADQRSAREAEMMAQLRARSASQGMPFDQNRARQTIDNENFKQNFRQQPQREQLSDNDRAGRAYQQRDAFMNYNGGANRLASRMQFVGDFAAVGAVMGTAMYAASSTVALQKEMKQLQAITKATDTEMQTLQGTIFAVGQATAYSTTEIAEAATVMGQAGYSAAQIRDAMPAIAMLATAAGGDLSDTVATVTSVLSIFDMSIDRTAKVSNMLAEALNGSKLSFDQLSLGLQYAGNVAADGGIQFEELTAALGAMSNAGIKSGSTLGTGLRALTQELENPSDKFLEWLRSVGLTADDVDIRTQGLAGAIGNLTAKSFDSGTAMNVFEIRAASAFSALSNNLDVMSDLESSMASSDAATEGAAVQMESFSAQAQRLKNSVTELATVAGAPLLAFLQGAMGALADMASATGVVAPLIQAITTSLMILMTISIGKWILGLIAGFAAMNGSLAATSFGIMALELQAGKLGPALAAATAGVRAFTVALLANPMTWFVVGATAAVMIFGAMSTAAANSAKRLEEFKTKANEARAETQKFTDRTQELTAFMDLLVDRSKALTGANGDISASVETAMGKFGEWGLVLEGNIKTIDDLIVRLANLRQAQAQASVESAQLEKDNILAQQRESLSQNPWQAAQTAAGRVMGMNTMTGMEGRVGSPPVPGQDDAQKLLDSAPGIKGLIQKLQTGTISASERTRLSGWLRANESKFPAQFRGRVTELRTSINSKGLNDLFGYESQLQSIDRRIADATVTASAQNAGIGIASAQQRQQEQTRDREIAAISDPDERVRQQAAEERRRQAITGSRNTSLTNAANELMMSDPTVAASFQRRAAASGQTPQQLIVQQFRANNPGVGALDAAAGNLTGSENVSQLRGRKRMLTARLATAGKITVPAERDAAQRAIRQEMMNVERRILQLSNPDMDAVTLEGMMDDSDAGGSARGATTLETSQERAARQRATTRAREVKGLERRIEQTAINTAAPAGATGSANEVRAMNFLQSKGLTAQQAAGIVGNLVHESGGMNTAALGDNGSAFGLAQWRGDRRSALDKFATGRGTNNTDFDTQMEFLWKEMQERGDLALVQGQSTTAGAAEVFARKFERPQGHDGALSGLSGWADRLSAAQRLTGSGTSTPIANPELQTLLDQWKAAKIDQIKQDAEASQTPPEDLAARLADFEMEADDYFNTVLSGNLTKMKELVADAASRAADQFSAEKTGELRVSGGDLQKSILQIQNGYDQAMEAAMAASDASFREKGVDPSVAQESVQKRQQIQQEFAEKAINATLAAVDAFFEGEMERLDARIEAQQLNIDRERSVISQRSNYYGNRNLGEVNRALGSEQARVLDERQAGLDVTKARGNFDLATQQRDRYQTEFANADEFGKGAALDKLVEANANVAQMASNLERAQMAFSAMTGEAPQFKSWTDALSASWAVFTERAGATKGTFEIVADGLLNTFQTAQAGFSTMVTSVLDGSKTMGDAFKDFTMSILQSLLDLATEILAKKILMWVIQFIAGSMGGGGGGMDAQGSSMLSGGPGAFTQGNYLNGGMGLWHGGEVKPRNMASGGLVTGSNPNRDSALINAMPGEVLMSKSAVDMVGKEELLAINARGNTRMSQMPNLASAMQAPREPDMVNVWVVAPDQKPQPTKKDIVAMISDDIATGGVTKQLIKAVAVGAA